LNALRGVERDGIDSAGIKRLQADEPAGLHVFGDGDARTIANEELAAVFIDAGDAWGTNYFLTPLSDPHRHYDQHVNIHPNFSTGLGVRITTPIGPLRLDWGFGSEGSRVHFSIGHVF